MFFNHQKTPKMFVRTDAYYLNKHIKCLSGQAQNNSSMLLESSCSEVENRKAEVSFSAR